MYVALGTERESTKDKYLINTHKLISITLQTTITYGLLCMEPWAHLVFHSWFTRVSTGCIFSISVQ